MSGKCPVTVRDCQVSVHHDRDTLCSGVTTRFSKQDHSDYAPNGQDRYINMSMPRRVSVKGMEGVSVTVIVAVVQGNVWMSIRPPFTWEAIMEPGKVDELMHVLELARDDAKRTPLARAGRVASGSGEALRTTPKGTPQPSNKPR
jgi:hypothetical protein